MRPVHQQGLCKISQEKIKVRKRATQCAAPDPRCKEISQEKKEWPEKIKTHSAVKVFVYLWRFRLRLMSWPGVWGFGGGGQWLKKITNPPDNETDP